MNRTVSIIGFGWLGLPLAEKLRAVGFTIRGSTTSPEKVQLLRRKGIDAWQLQLNPEPLGDLSALLAADVLIINIPPKAGKLGDAFHPQQVRGLVEAIRPSSVSHVVYVSSTSVYPELNRVMVEDDITEPGQSAAPALMQTEQLIQELKPDRSVTILRCGGLMGYDRIPGKYVAGRTVDSGGVPVNYIHRDDAVGILRLLVQQSITGTFNAVAPEHPLREAVYRKSCADFGYELPTFVVPPEPVPHKVVSPDKLVETLKYAFIYPDPLMFPYGLRP